MVSSPSYAGPTMPQAPLTAPLPLALRQAGALLLLAGAVRAVEVPATAVAPGPAEHGLLSWREGPPYYTTARYAEERRFLRFETGRWSAELDTIAADLTGFASVVPREAAASAAAARAAAPLPSSRLHLAVVAEGQVYRVRGRRPPVLDSHGQPTPPLEFPVRIIETGRHFQRVTLHDLDLRDDAGRPFPGEAHLELAAWPDRLVLSLVARPARDLATARGWVRLQATGGRDASVQPGAGPWGAGQEQAATLVLGPDGAACSPAAPPGVSVVAADGAQALAVAWNAREQAHEISVPGPGWGPPEEGIFPEPHLDAISRHALTLRNERDEPVTARLKWIHRDPPAITGCVPLLLDDAGRPTGLPLQVSKNWHHVRGGVPAPASAGTWLHVRGVLQLPPRSRVRLQPAMTFARWGGVPAASVAQLCLVGWGHNGFWDQFALGSFGESLCVQPGRVMRRALLTDLRPLLQLGFARGERWAWASNVGGADTVVRLDPAGRYIPFRRNTGLPVSPGPNLARVDYEEEAADGALWSQVTIQLARADDLARVRVHAVHRVRRRVEYGALAWFQFGADHYNEADAPRLAWGDAAGLGREVSPAPGDPLPRWEAGGLAPWLSLHGQPRAERERNGQASRGLVVRAWRARIGGREVPAPWWAAGRRPAAGERIGVDLIPPPGPKVLEAGDEVAMELEFFALPMAADLYYGPAEDLRGALADGANTWRPVWREARENRPLLRREDGSITRDFPLAVPVPPAGFARFRLEGGLGRVTVRLTGLPDPAAVELRRAEGGLSPADAHAQAEQETSTGTWSLVFNLPAAGAGQDYVVEPIGVPALVAP